MDIQFNIIHSIKKQLDSLPKAEKIVANYIVVHSSSIPNLNIHDLSAKCGGTPSAITRLCKRLNVKGYSQLRLGIMSELSRTNLGHSERTSPVTQDMEISHSIIERNISTLRNLEGIIDLKKIRESAEMIIRARRVDIYGTGTSSVVAYDLHMKLQNIGLNSHFSMSEHLQLTGACNLTRRDVAIAISYTGETEAVIQSSTIAAKQNACLITLTSNVENSLAKIAEIPLFVPVTEPHLHIGAMSSRIIQLVLIDLLYYYITQDDPEVTLKKLLKTANASHRTN